MAGPRSWRTWRNTWPLNSDCRLVRFHVREQSRAKKIGRLNNLQNVPHVLHNAGIIRIAV